MKSRLLLEAIAWGFIIRTLSLTFFVLEKHTNVEIAYSYWFSPLGELLICTVFGLSVVILAEWVKGRRL